MDEEKIMSIPILTIIIKINLLDVYYIALLTCNAVIILALGYLLYYILVVSIREKKGENK